MSDHEELQWENLAPCLLNLLDSCEIGIEDATYSTVANMFSAVELTFIIRCSCYEHRRLIQTIQKLRYSHLISNDRSWLDFPPDSLQITQ